MKNKKTILMAGIFVCIAFITCCMFPFLNLTKETPIKSDIFQYLIMGILIVFHYNIGQSEAKIFSNSSAIFIILFNLAATAFGMGSRYLIEFAEVSNVYNFTLQNIILHTLITVVLTSGMCVFCKKIASNK